MKKALYFSVLFLSSIVVSEASNIGGIRVRGDVICHGGRIISQNGDIVFESDKVQLDHAQISATGVVDIKAKKLENRASKIASATAISVDATEQRNETVINKYVHESSSGSDYVHIEGISSVDDCEFIAPIVIQKGEKIENIGIKVNADVFTDLGISTSNMPACIVLHNYSHVEKSGLFSSASSDYRRIDDVLVPSRYHVNYYRSLADTSGKPTEVKFGYTLIKAGADIIVTKDVKEDVPIPERHSIEIHEETSGFSLFGGVSVPDPLGPLQSLRSAYERDNLLGFSTSTIASVAKGIRINEDINTLSQLAQTPSWNLQSTALFLSVLSHFVQGPSVQFGSKSVTFHQNETITRGNSFEAKNMVFKNAQKASFGGNYHAQNIDIETSTFITFSLPHEIETSQSIHQSGVSLDLLSFAVALINPNVAGLTNTMLSSSAASISSRRAKMFYRGNELTNITANQSFKIKAEHGIITKTQIKAALVHAIFTDSLIVKTLTNEFRSSHTGGSVSGGVGSFAGGFSDVCSQLNQIASNATISVTDSRKFEKVIDDYASFIGTEEFYLKVGNILETESAFLGHLRRDARKETIEAKHVIQKDADQVKEEHDSSFSVSFCDFVTIANELKSHAYKQAIDEGKTEEEACHVAVDKVKEINEAKEEIDAIAEEIIKIDTGIKRKAQSSTADKKKVLVAALNTLSKKQAELETKKTDGLIQEIALQTKIEALTAAKLQYLQDLSALEQSAKHEDADTAVSMERIRLWSLYDDMSAVPFESITLSQSSEQKIRAEAEQQTVRDFQRLRDTIEAEYRSYVRFEKGEGFATEPQARPIFAGCGVPITITVSVEELNKPENRLERLKQEELYKIGESTVHNVARVIPAVGAYIDYHFDRISTKAFVGTLGIDVAPYATIGKMHKSVAASKMACRHQFARNLNARFNQAPYNPRAMESLLQSKYATSTVSSSTMPKSNAKNVKLANGGKIVTIGVDEITGEQITKHIPFNARGLPVFDDICVCDLKLPESIAKVQDRKIHFKEATRQLKGLIENGNIDGKLFSAEQLDCIKDCRPVIPGFTWHHHENFGRLQLVSKEVHKDIGHFGGFNLWFK